MEGYVGNELKFGDILEQAETWSLDDQEALVEVLQNRMRDRRRAELVKDVQEAVAEFQAGGSTPVTAKELVQEILS